MKHFSLVTIGLLIVISPLYSQQSFSLKALIDSALQKNFDIAIVRNNLQIAQNNNHIGVAGGLPTVSSTVNDNEQVQTTNLKFANPANDLSRNNVASNNFSANITGTMVLYNGLRIKSAKKRLDLLEKQAEMQLNAQIQNTIAAVMLQYFEVIRQQAFAKTLEQNIATAKERLSIVLTRKEVGLANNADYFQSQIDVNALEQQLKSQELVIAQAKTDLLAAAQMPLQTLYTITDTAINYQSLNIAALQQQLKSNPNLLAAEQQINISQFLLKETAALRTPTLRVNTGYNFTNNRAAAGFSLLTRTFGPFLGVNLAIPIYNGSALKRQEKNAKINQENAIIQKSAIEFDLQTNLQRNFDAYTNAQAQLQTQKENYQLSQQLLNLVMQRFQLGQATIVDVKQAQQSFETEGFRLTNLQYAAKIAEINMLLLANQLSY